MVSQNAGSSANASTLSPGSPRPVFSLFDVSRLHMSQSYSLSYFSGGRQGQMIGMYINQIDYEFAKPLHVSFSIAYLHQPQGMFGAQTQSSIGNRLLPGVRLDWRPSKYFRFVMSYQTVSPYEYYYGSPYGRFDSVFDDR